MEAERGRPRPAPRSRGTGDLAKAAPFPSPDPLVSPLAHSDTRVHRTVTPRRALPIQNAVMATKIHSEPAERLLNRELSQLDFHSRVLELAGDESLPLLERVRFCAIFSSNIDEFFQVRVAGLLGQAESGLAMRSPDGLTPQQALSRIRERMMERHCATVAHLEEAAPPGPRRGRHRRRPHRGLLREGVDAAEEDLRARDLPDPHATCRRTRSAFPVHLRTFALAGGLRRGSGDR